MDTNQTPWQVGDEGTIVTHSTYGGPPTVELVTVTKVSATQLTLSNGRRAAIRTERIHGTRGVLHRRDDPVAMRFVAQAAMRELSRRADNAAFVWSRNQTVENGRAVLTTMQAWLDAQTADKP